MSSSKTYIVRIILLLAFVIKLEGVTVNPLCPTNKIAPNRRNVRSERRSARTIGAFYDLLVPDGLQANRPSPLQEAQDDAPDECGEIEDYDENDLSSVTPKSTRRQGQRGFNRPLNMFLQHLGFNNPQAQKTSTAPPYKPTRPPTGGYFGTNGYRPQPQHEPSDYIKPVNEGAGEPHITYRPGVVGAPSGYIVGAVQVKPDRRPVPSATVNRPYKYSSYAYPSTTNPNYHKYQNRPRHGDPGVLESFIDLLF